VLAVDDETTITELLCVALRHEGWDARTAATGSDAVRVAPDFSPDVAILDMMLPDLDGFEVLRRLRVDQPLLPLVFLSARDGVADRIAGLPAGGMTTSPSPWGSRNSSPGWKRCSGVPAPPPWPATACWPSGT